MFTSQVLYCISSNKTLDIQIHYFDKKVLTLTENIEMLFNTILLNDLTTLKGRLDAIKKKYGMQKNIPIYLQPDLVFFRLSLDDEDIYINAYMVLKIASHKDKTSIFFKNGTILEVNKNARLINRQWRRSLLIEKRDENVY